jgi:heme a synthase
VSIQTQSDVKPREGPWPYRLVAVLSVAFVFVAFTQPMLAWQPALAALAISMRPRALVRFLAVATFVLLLIGGAVTTYRVGMAVPDWPQTMGHNMFTYPLSEMIKSGPVSLEHSHRLWATGVGLITVCLAVGCFLRPEGRELRALSIVALIAVCIQGVLGGTRVLENSTNLAFLHGAFAQVFYAIVAVLFVRTTQAWNTATSKDTLEATSLKRRARFAVGLVYAQIALGAWVRHSGNTTGLAFHAALAFAVLVVVLGLVKELRQSAGGDQASPLARTASLLTGTVFVQVLLGILAAGAIFVVGAGFEGTVTVAEAVTATLHVAVGALLLSGCVAAFLWAGRAIDDTQVAGGVA